MTSSEKDANSNFAGFKAFSPIRNTAWRVAKGINSDFWMALYSIEPVRIYKFTAQTPVATKLIKWTIQGGNDHNPNWKDLPFTTRSIEDGITYIFKIDPALAEEYQWYRIFVEESEGVNPGLSYWQLYTVNPLLIL